jgi:S-adenosylmethionine:tRNA-ribosyltransferase-isomerase (queuine synthetase)
MVKKCSKVKRKSTVKAKKKSIVKGKRKSTVRRKSHFSFVTHKIDAKIMKENWGNKIRIATVNKKEDTGIKNEVKVYGYIPYKEFISKPQRKRTPTEQRKYSSDIKRDFRKMYKSDSKPR